jgi:hypothetical protein
MTHISTPAWSVIAVIVLHQPTIKPTWAEPRRKSMPRPKAVKAKTRLAVAQHLPGEK